MSKFDYRNIEKVPGRSGGRAVIGGTRIRVCVILNWYRQGTTVEEIVQTYPELRPSDVHDALAYAYEHLQEIETDVASDVDAVSDRKLVDLKCRGSDERHAADLRHRLQTIAEDWERPEMEAYDAL
ncbi:MAG: DUF433 domain-containing protein [Planctomycetaceae bacterium]|nr:DUF433 domain-containing protein [Planctomycetaceae bacterium]